MARLLYAADGARMSSGGKGEGEDDEKMWGVGWAAYCLLPAHGKNMFCSPSSYDADPKQAARLMVTMSGLGHGSGRAPAPSSRTGLRA